jgi:hypothetical protein
MMKNRTYLRKMLFLLMAVSISFAGIAQNPDFSGKWKLNESKSKMGAEFSFAPSEITIEQEANKMTTTRVNEFQGNVRERTTSYSLDGKESKNEGFQGSEIITIAAWEEDGQSLKMVTSFEMRDGGEMTITAIYKLDGGNLVINNSMEGGPRESSPETWVFDKQ